MRLPNMAVFHRVVAAVTAMIVRLARRMTLTSHRASRSLRRQSSAPPDRAVTQIPA